MATVEREKGFNVGADVVWKVIGDFAAVDKWAPGIEKVEISDGGKTRTIFLPGGARIVEHLTAEGDKTQSYALDPGGALPVVGYTSTLSAEDTADGGCVVRWTGSFEPAEGTTEETAVQIIGMVYDGGLSGIEKAIA
jgi:mxaD protein